MKTAEIINIVCSDLGIAKADLAKRMGMIPSSLYRKLARESMTLRELQECLDVLGVERRASDFHRKSLRDLRAELSNAIGYMELWERNDTKAEQYPEKVRSVFSEMKLTIAYALGEELDDNELNRAILKDILIEYGLTVEEAGNGSEAFARVLAKDPGYYHFILMALEMPVMDGYEATMKIRKLPNRIRANVPIIALTANVVRENRQRASAVGMDDFLVKPVSSARLLGVMSRLL